jgi:hypothetical protein
LNSIVTRSEKDINELPPATPRIKWQRNHYPEYQRASKEQNILPAGSRSIQSSRTFQTQLVRSLAASQPVFTSGALVMLDPPF